MRLSVSVTAVAIVAMLLACIGEDDPPGTCDVFASAACLDGQRMMSDVETLAGPQYAGRRAGTPDADRAAALVEARFRAAGLAPAVGSGYLQPFSFVDWVPTAAALSLGGVPATIGAAYEVVYGSASGTVTPTELVFVGYGIRIPPFSREAYPECPFPETGFDEFAMVDLEGRIVVAFRGYPDGDAEIVHCPSEPDACAAPVDPTNPGACHMRVATKARHAARRGALGLLLVRPYWDPEPGAATPFTTAGEEILPTLALDRSTLERFLPDVPDWASAIDAGRTPSSNGTPVVSAMAVAGEYRELAASNVIGLVRGADPALAGEAVVVGAHLDHMGRLPFRETYFAGADDNASGTAVVLELARAVAESPTRPERTLVFATWNAEEEGLVGSCHYVEVQPVHPLEQTVAAFSVDMVGAGTPGLELWGATEWPWIVDATDRGAADLGLAWRVTAQPPLTASDHACFRERGIPAFLAFTPTILEHPAYHTVDDVAAGVSRENLEASARLLWAGVREIATGRAPVAASAPRAPAAAIAGPAPATGAQPEPLPRYVARPRSAFEE